MFLSLNTKIKQFLFQKTRFYECQVDNEVVKRKEELSYYKNQLVIPRGKSVFKVFSVGELKAADIEAFVANQAVSLSPFASFGFHVSIKNDSAMLWVWDSEYELGLMEEFGLNHNDTQIVPETVLYPIQSKASLVSCICGGYEGQIWQNETLVASRYWLKKPNANQLRAFYSSFEVSSAATTNHFNPENFTVFPWNEKQWSFLLNKEFLTSATPLIGVSVLVFLLGWQLTRYAVLLGALSLKESEIEYMQGAVESTLSTRQKALKLNQENNAINSIVVKPQLKYLDEISRKLTDEVEEFYSWSYQNNTIEIVLGVADSESLDVATLVRNLEELLYVKSVSARRLGTTGNRWEVTVEVKS
jgi:hypothetical protein